MASETAAVPRKAAYHHGGLRDALISAAHRLVLEGGADKFSLADACRLAGVSTAAPYRPDKGDQGPGAPYNSAAKFYRVYTDSIEGTPDVRVSHIGIDRKHTTAEDVHSWFPLRQLKRLSAMKRRLVDVLRALQSI